MALTDVNLFRIDGTVGSVSNVQTAALNGGPLAGARNRIINGDMRIDQRNAGASVSLSGTGQYTVDRWLAWEDTDGTMTAQQSSVAPTSFTNSLLFTTGTADSSLSATQFAAVQQRIEGFNVADLAWGTASAAPVTLSFWVRSSLTGTFGGVIKNSGGSRSYPFTYTIAAANTWEQKTLTITGDTTGTWLTNNGIGIIVGFGLGVGSTYSGTAGSWQGADLLSATGATSVIGTASATFYITGVQLEPGTVATPFERRSYGQELALCQRYAYAWGLAGQQLAAAYTTGLYSDANQITMHPLGVNISQMRAIPTNITLIGTQGTDWAVQTASGVNQTGFSIATNIGAITANKASHGLVGNAANLQVLNSNGRIIISSEL